jgi:hypothetical protein
MRYADSSIHLQWDKLFDQNPSLHALLSFADHYARTAFHKDLLITSIRSYGNPRSVHAHWRGADIRIERGRDDIDDISDDEANELAAVLNTAFGYRSRWRPWKTHSVAVVERFPDNPFQNHIHVQTPRRGQWR